MTTMKGDYCNDKYRKYYREYYKSHPEKMREKRNKYYKLHPDRMKKFKQNYFKNNKEKIYMRARKYDKTWRRRMREAALSILGNKCIRCGFSDERALQIDHIQGNGNKERKTITTNLNKIVVESISKGENKYQLLCANCNWIKKFENKEHKKTKYNN